MLSVRERGSGSPGHALSLAPVQDLVRAEGVRLDETRGLTLVELLIVMVIIALLASIAVPKFSASREKSFVSSMKSDLKNLAIRQEIHHGDASTYSTSLTTLDVVPSDGVTITINEATGAGWAATAIHAGLTAEHCGMYQGNAAVVGGDPGPAEGVIACTR